MTTAVGKITAAECLDQIVGHIRTQLSRCSAFSNNSLSYFGLELDYSITLTTHSRGRETIKLGGGGKVIGEAVTDANREEMTSETHTVTDSVVAGTAARGMVSVVPREREKAATSETPAPAATPAAAGGVGTVPHVGKQPAGRGAKKDQRHPAGASGDAA